MGSSKSYFVNFTLKSIIETLDPNQQLVAFDQCVEGMDSGGFSDVRSLLVYAAHFCTQADLTSVALAATTMSLPGFRCCSSERLVMNFLGAKQTRVSRSHHGKHHVVVGVAHSCGSLPIRNLQLLPQ